MSDADWGPSSIACLRWQASARKKRRPEAISEGLSQLLSTAKCAGRGRDRPPWAAHVLAAGCAAQQPRSLWLEARRGPKSFGLGARAARLSGPRLRLCIFHCTNRVPDATPCCTDHGGGGPVFPLPAPAARGQEREAGQTPLPDAQRTAPTATRATPGATVARRTGSPRRWATTAVSASARPFTTGPAAASGARATAT